MSHPIRTALTVAAGLAVALVAVPARADHDRDRYGVPVAPAYTYPARPVYQPVPAVRPQHRRAQWLRHERRELRREYRQLERARHDFYATWDHNGWRRNRFESWYASRRAEIDRRWAALNG